ncbi:MAG: response regulator [Patescibacteria group bacterium]|nr:response regulator [Patescibacteria group bacterium]
MLNDLIDKFTREGFSALGAKDGEEGLASAISYQPDLILLDIVLPKMDGMTMMRKLREQSEWGKKVPIILLTNLNADDQIMMGVAKDEPAFYLIKTEWTLDDVVKKVKQSLNMLKPEETGAI